MCPMDVRISDYILNNSACAFHRMQPLPNMYYRLCTGCVEVVIWIRSGRKDLLRERRRELKTCLTGSRKPSARYFILLIRSRGVLKSRCAFCAGIPFDKDSHVDSLFRLFWADDRRADSCRYRRRSTGNPAISSRASSNGRVNPGYYVLPFRAHRDSSRLHICSTGVSHRRMVKFISAW